MIPPLYWLYGSSGREIELQGIVNGLVNTQMYNFLGNDRTRLGCETSLVASTIQECTVQKPCNSKYSGSPLMVPKAHVAQGICFSISL